MDIADDFKEGAQAPSSDIAQLRQLAANLENARLMAEQLEEAAAAAKRAYEQLRRKTLPDAMMALSLSEFTTDDGLRVVLEDFVAGTLPKEDSGKRAQAIAHLNEIGGADLLSRTITLRYPRSGSNEAVVVAEAIKSGRVFVLDDDGTPMLKVSPPDVTMNEQVHPQTLCAFVRQLLREGRECDPEKLGLFVGHVVSVKKARKSAHAGGME
jgi:hypothetical protein